MGRSTRAGNRSEPDQKSNLSNLSLRLADGQGAEMGNGMIDHVVIDPAEMNNTPLE